MAGLARLSGRTPDSLTPADEEELMTSDDFTAWRKATYSEANADCVEVGWRKASYSAANADCVEVRWRKATYSEANADCVEVGWRKATYSAPNADCVEVGWRKATYSAANANCVEVGADRRVVGVRDTKQTGAGPVLEFPAAAWRAFIAAAKAAR
jgi:hypothetical protein